MNRSFIRRWLRPACGLVTATLLLVTLAGATGASAARGSSSSAETVYAINTRNQLLTFRSDNPAHIIARQRVSGLQPGETVLGIDFRPANGKLYGLGSANRLYTIDPQSGTAAQVGMGTFAVPLEGTAFGFDVNPAVDRIRVVSNTGQNLRLNPNDGTVVDADPATPGVQADSRLAYDNTDTDGDPVDVNAGRRPSVVGAAYTNPDNDPATGTTLYDIDSALDTLATQVPPNNGTLNTIGSLTLDTSSLADSGLLGGGRAAGRVLPIDTGDLTGFDISQSGTAYAALSVRGRISAFVTLDIGTGRITPVSVIGRNEGVVGLAVPTQP